MRTALHVDRDDTEGFSLVELLVVITIISVLAAIAIPVFINQRQKAYRAQMQSDLHSLITAELAYSADNNGSYTTDLTALGGQGYRASKSVAAHVKLAGTSYQACTSSSSTTTWLVYDSSTGAQAYGSDCA
jgi:type IV pilus assembly protein PilA